MSQRVGSALQSAILSDDLKGKVATQCPAVVKRYAMSRTALLLTLVIQGCVLPSIRREDASAEVAVDDVPTARLSVPASVELVYYYRAPFSVATPATAVTMGSKIVVDATHVYATAYFPPVASDGGVSPGQSFVYAKPKRESIWSRMIAVTGANAPAALALDNQGTLQHALLCTPPCSLGSVMQPAAARIEYRSPDAGAVNFDAGTVEYSATLNPRSSIEVSTSPLDRAVYWSYLSGNLRSNRVFLRSAQPSDRPIIVPTSNDAATGDASVGDAIYPATVHTVHSVNGVTHVAAMREVNGRYVSIDLLRRDGGAIERTQSIPSPASVSTTNPEDIVVSSVATSPNGTLFVLVLDGENEFALYGVLHRFSPTGQPVGTPRLVGRMDKTAQLHVINDQDLFIISGGAVQFGLAVWQSNNGGEGFFTQQQIAIGNAFALDQNISGLTALSIATPTTSPVGWDPYVIRGVVSFQEINSGRAMFSGAGFFEIPIGH